MELFPNDSRELFPDNTLKSLRKLLREQVNLEGQWEVTISDISYPSMFQKITQKKFKFFDEKLSKSTTTYNLEPCINTSIT